VKVVRAASVRPANEETKRVSASRTFSGSHFSVPSEADLRASIGSSGARKRNVERDAQDLNAPAFTQEQRQLRVACAAISVNRDKRKPR
jgi:hypothetical protein